VLENKTKNSFSHITSFTMAQNHKFLAKIFFVPNCQIFAENDKNKLKKAIFDDILTNFDRNKQDFCYYWLLLKNMYLTFNFSWKFKQF
jgi:hypothetical protein